MQNYFRPHTPATPLLPLAHVLKFHLWQRALEHMNCWPHASNERCLRGLSDVGRASKKCEKQFDILGTRPLVRAVRSEYGMRVKQQTRRLNPLTHFSNINNKNRKSVSILQFKYYLLYHARHRPERVQFKLLLLLFNLLFQNLRPNYRHTFPAAGRKILTLMIKIMFMHW